MILGIDSATDSLGIGLADEGRVVAERMWVSGRHHTVELAPAVALVLRETKTTISMLSALAIASGPGSYTGLRIGMGFAKGIALGAGIPLVGVPTLDILARGQPSSDESLLAVLRAGRGRIAALWYKWRQSAWEAMREPAVTTWEEVLASIEAPTLISGEIGDARRLLKRDRRIRLAEPSACVRRPSHLIEIARERLEGSDVDSAALAPVYLGVIGAGED